MENHIPFWLSTAFAELGQADEAKYGGTPGEPWCSLFLKWVFGQTFMPVDEVTAMARSWLKWGKEILTPQTGAIAVFSRPEGGADAGHVAIYLDSHNGYVYVLGGNQSGRVGISRYLAAQVLGYRWPIQLAGEAQ